MTATYRTLIIGGIAFLATSAAWRPDLAIVALTAIALGAFIRSAKWKAAYEEADSDAHIIAYERVIRREWAGAIE